MVKKYSRKYSLFVSFLLVISCVGFLSQTAFAVAEQSELPKLSDEDTFIAALHDDMVVGFFNRYWISVAEKEVDGYYRKLIKKVDDKHFLVQDFFSDTNEKQSDPVLIGSIYELKQSGFLKSIKGPYVTWYRNGKKQYQVFYKEKNSLDGSIEAWYPNGKLKLKGFYNNNNKEGVWQEWYENGKKKLEANYKEGALEGIYKKWHENGKKQTLGTYKAGLLTGLWIVWDSKGRKVSEGEYVDSQRERVWTYYLSGKKWAEGSYINNLQNETWTYWNADGTKSKEVFYQKGIKIDEKDF